MVHDRDGFEPLQKTRPLIPGHDGMTWLDNVLTLKRRQRHRRDRVKTQIFGKTPIGKLDLVKDWSRPAHEIHFVDRQRDVANAQHGNDAAVSLGLRETSLTGVDQKYGRRGGRRASRHIASILLVAWGVGHDEATSGRRKEPISDVYSDALLAFSLQSVNQQCKVQALSLRTEFFGV